MILSLRLAKIVLKVEAVDSLATVAVAKVAVATGRIAAVTYTDGSIVFIRCRLSGPRVIRGSLAHLTRQSVHKPDHL